MTVKIRAALSLITSLLAASVAAAPVQELYSRDGTVTLTQSQLLVIAPKSSCCTGALKADQCITAKKALDPLNKAFATYQITSAAEAAALISLQAFESVEYKYNVNVSPGRPGQGTYNMQMITYNLKYAQNITAIKSDLDAIVGSETDGTKLSDDKKNQALALLDKTPEYSLGSAAWFLTSQCDSDTRAGLQKGTDDGWSTYLTKCIGTTVTDERKTYWDAAKKALSVSSS